MAAGKVVTWQSITMFRIRDGKIAEERVCRDKLGMLMQLGAAPSFPTVPMPAVYAV